MAKQKCFIIMPITTPDKSTAEYSGGDKHFERVLECLFKPAIGKAGFDPVPPIMEGTNMIRPSIIEKLNEADLVLCDLSSFNPNVFFEFGIRTALNKPVCLVRDEKTKHIPFDISDLNCYTYSSSLQMWEGDQIGTLSEHILKTSKTQGNQLWKYFGVSVAASSMPSPSETDKLDYLINLVESVKGELSSRFWTIPPTYNIPADLTGIEWLSKSPLITLEEMNKKPK